MNIENQLKKLYAFEMTICFRIADAVWVLFLLQRGFSLAQAGLAEGIFHITSLIFEVPSGMAADLFGRRRTLMTAGILGMLSAAGMCLKGGFWLVCVGMSLSAISCNMISGTEEAMVYDSLAECGQAERFGRVWAKLSIIGRCGSAVSCLISPVAMALGYRGTYLVSGGLYLLSCFSAAAMAEPMVTELQKKRQEHPFQKMGIRLAEHVRISAAFVAAHPRTMCKLLADAAIACPTYLTVMFLQEHLTARGWPAAWIGLPLLMMRLCGAAGVWLASRKSGRLQRSLLLCGIFGGVGACLAGSGWIPFILAGAGLVQICESISEIRVSTSVNREFESDQRATMASIGSMLYSLLMIAVSPAVGGVSDRFGTSAGFSVLGITLMAGTILCGSLLASARRYRRQRASGQDGEGRRDRESRRDKRADEISKQAR